MGFPHSHPPTLEKGLNIPNKKGEKFAKIDYVLGGTNLSKYVMNIIEKEKNQTECGMKADQENKRQADKVCGHRGRYMCALLMVQVLVHRWHPPPASTGPAESESTSTAFYYVLPPYSQLRVL